MNQTLEIYECEIIANGSRRLGGKISVMPPGVGPTLVPRTRELNAFYTLFLRHPWEGSSSRDPLMSGDSAKC